MKKKSGGCVAVCGERRGSGERENREKKWSRSVYVQVGG